jgi:hypothetical protein
MQGMENNVYGRSAAYVNGHVLDEDEMYKLAPSIFAEAPHESRSGRFVPIPTIEVLRGLAAEGFLPVGVKQSRTRDEGKREYTKHLIRLRRVDDSLAYKVNDTVSEVILKNANDGSCRYDLMAGLFRIRCLNSLVTQTSILESVKVRHSGSAQEVKLRVIEGTYKVLDAAHAALEAPEKWGAIALAPQAQQVFAEGAHVLRFADAEGKVRTPIKAHQLNHARRTGDEGQDLWSTFNRVQENALKGGLSARPQWRPGEPWRQVTTRAVKGIDQDVKLNQALWVLATKMAEILGTH